MYKLLLEITEAVFSNLFSIVSANKEENISLLSTQIGFFTGGVLFGALIASTVCILVIKKRTRRKKHGRNYFRLLFLLAMLNISYIH